MSMPRPRKVSTGLTRTQIESHFLGTAHVLASALDEVTQFVSGDPQVHHMLDDTDCDVVITMTVEARRKGTLR